MREVLYVFSLFIIAIIHIIILFRQNWQNGGVTTHSAVLFTMLFYFEIVPILIYLGVVSQSDASYSLMVNMILKCSPGEFILAECSVLAFTLAFDISYKRYNNRQKIVAYSFNEERMHKALKVIAFITVIIGGTAFILYIQAFGGISSLLSYADYFRSFRTNKTDIIGYGSTLLVVPARLILVAPIVLWPFIKDTLRHRGILKVLFIVVLAFSVIFLLFNAGKTGIVVMILCFAIPFLNKFTKHSWALCIIGGCFMLPILGAMDSLFAYLTTGRWYVFSTTGSTYIGQFSYVYANILKLNTMVNSSGLRWGSDFITGVLNLLPGLDFSASYEVTSALYYGPNWMQIAGVPDDIITFGYLQFGIIGVALVGVILGFFCGKIDFLIRQMDKDKYAVIITSVILCMYSYVVNADIGVLIKSQFQLTLCSFCILYSVRRNDTLTNS